MNLINQYKMRIEGNVTLLCLALPIALKGGGGAEKKKKKGEGGGRQHQSSLGGGAIDHGDNKSKARDPNPSRDDLKTRSLLAPEAAGLPPLATPLF